MLALILHLTGRKGLIEYAAGAGTVTIGCIPKVGLISSIYEYAQIRSYKRLGPECHFLWINESNLYLPGSMCLLGEIL
jgi:hypothetical protein